MKANLLNGLIRKSAPLVAAALLLSLTTAAWAQLPHDRGTLYTDGCYYILKSNLVIPAGQPGYLVLERQGCRVLGRDGRIYYHDYRTKIWQDELTGTEYVLTNRGWMDLADYQAQQQQTKRDPLDGVSNPVTLQQLQQTLDNLDELQFSGSLLQNSRYKDGTTKASAIVFLFVPYRALQSDRSLVITT